MKLWIARNKDGTLALHESEPYCPYDTWYNSNQEMYLDKSLFPEVTVENSPQEVELKLINNVFLMKATNIFLVEWKTV